MMPGAARARSFRRDQPRGLAVDEVEIMLDRWKIICPRFVDPLP